MERLIMTRLKDGEVRRAHRALSLRLMQFPIPHHAESKRARQRERRRGVVERRGGKGKATGS